MLAGEQITGLSDAYVDLGYRIAAPAFGKRRMQIYAKGQHPGASRGLCTSRAAMADFDVTVSRRQDALGEKPFVAGSADAHFESH
jgi:hypothetical protein